jgi:hypothetical protein
MPLPKITANHVESGIWNFGCPLHDTPHEDTAVSSPRQAMSVLKEHMDKMHPGVSARLVVHSQYSGTTTITYTGTQTVQTGDKL